MWFDVIQPTGSTQKVFVPIDNINYFQAWNPKTTGVRLKNQELLEVKENIVHHQAHFSTVVAVDKKGSK